MIACIALCACRPAAPSVSPASLDAPANFAALYVSNAVYLSWDPVRNASGYQLHVLAPPDTETAGRDEQVFAVAGTGVKVLLPQGDPGFTFSVSAVAGGLLSPRSRSLGAAGVPSFSVTQGVHSAHLHWDAQRFGPALISRALDPNAFSTVGQSDSGDYDVTGLEPNTTYYWQVLMGARPLQYLPDPKRTLTPPRAPLDVAVSYPDDRPVLTWTGVPGAGWYSVTGGEPPVETQIGNPPWYEVRCLGVPKCSFLIASVNTEGSKGDSTQVTVTMPPPWPGAPKVTPGSGKVQIDLPALTLGADHLVVESSAVGSGSWTEVASATGGTITLASTPWMSTTFGVRAVTPDGVRSAVRDAVTVYVLGDPDSVNLNGAPASPDPASEGQRVVFRRGGQLVGLEIAWTTASSSALAALSAGEDLKPNYAVRQGAYVSSLSPDFVSGTLLDFSATPLPVSAGESLDMLFSNASPAMSSGTAGGHLLHGSLDAAHDLVYKVYVKPDSTMSPIDPVRATPGVGAVRVRWTPSPGAIQYDVHGSDDGGAARFLGSTDQPWFDDPGVPVGAQRLYTVAAVGALATVSASAATAAAPLPARLSAQSLGDAPAAEVRLCPPGWDVNGAVAQLGQTFTSSADGTLDSVEFRIEWAEIFQTMLVVEVLDANGLSLGKVTSPLVPTRPIPLDRTVPSAARIDLASLAVSVRAGDRLQLRLTIQTSAAGPNCAALRDAQGTYAGGEEIRAGVPVPDRDLAFRVLVR